MTAFFSNITGNLRAAAVLAIGVSAGLAGFSGTARAADGIYGDRFGKDYRHTVERRYDRGGRDDRDRTDVRIDIDFNSGRTQYRPCYTERRVRYWVEPAYRVVSERVWVEPVYRTVNERVWAPPVHRTVYEEVNVPARYEVREVVRYQRGRKVIIRERTLIEPARCERVAREVCVSEGRWDIVEKRVCVSEGHWDVVEKRVCESEGRWDYRVEQIETFGDEQTRLDVRF